MSRFSEEELTSIFNKYDRNFNTERRIYSEIFNDDSVQNYARYLMNLHEW